MSKVCSAVSMPSSDIVNQFGLQSNKVVTENHVHFLACTYFLLIRFPVNLTINTVTWSGDLFIHGNNQCSAMTIEYEDSISLIFMVQLNECLVS